MSGLVVKLPSQDAGVKRAGPSKWDEIGPSKRCRFGEGQFKPTRMCAYFPQGTCQRGDACTFAHTADELADGTDLTLAQAMTGAPGSPGFRPTKMCTFFLQGTCTKGNTCTFAHHEEELSGSGNAGLKYVQSLLGELEMPIDAPGAASAPSAARQEVLNVRRPTKMCTFFGNNACSKGDACTYAHTEDELAPGARERLLRESLLGSSEGAAPSSTRQGAQEEALAHELSDAALERQLLEGTLLPPPPAVALVDGPREFEGGRKPPCLCRFWVEHPSRCKQGDSCTFAHGILEMADDPRSSIEILAGAGLFGEKAAHNLGHQAHFLQAPPSQKGWQGGGGGCGAKGGKGWQGKGGGIALPAAFALPQDTSWGGKGAQKGGPSQMFRPTKLCQYWVQDPTLCQKGDNCTFAHGIQELPPEIAATCGVSRFHHAAFKPTQLCTFFDQGKCGKGLNCTFAHSLEELVGQ